MSIFKPSVTWAERKETAFITVEIQNAKDLKIDLEETGLNFHAVANDKTYEFSLEFPEKVDKEQSKYSSDRLIHILLHKQEAKRWHKITNEASKLHWLKCDWNKWQDTDDEEEQAFGGGDKGPYGDMDFSQFGNLGDMGDMGDMGDPNSFGDDDDESDGTLEGVDGQPGGATESELTKLMNTEEEGVAPPLGEPVKDVKNGTTAAAGET